MPFVGNHNLVYIKNIDQKKPLEVKWGGVVQAVLAPNEVLPFPPDVAGHARDTLVSRLLIRAGKKPNNEKFKKALESKIVVDGDLSKRPQIKQRNEAEESAAEIQALHRKERARQAALETDDSDEPRTSLAKKPLNSIGKSHTVLRPKHHDEESDAIENDSEEEIIDPELQEVTEAFEAAPSIPDDELMSEDDDVEQIDEVEEEVETTADEVYEEEAEPSEDDIDAVLNGDDVEEVKEEINRVQKLPTRQELYDWGERNSGINTKDPKMFTYLESLGVRDLMKEVGYSEDEE